MSNKDISKTNITLTEANDQIRSDQKESYNDLETPKLILKKILNHL